jgi:hypothetical protein
MAKNQKYRSSPFAYPFPVSVWNKWSKEKLPEEDDRLNMKRRITYDSGMGNLKPTKVTNTKEEWEYTIPAGRTGIVDQVLAFEKKKKPLGFGAAKLVQPSKRAQKERNAMPQSMSYGVGPLYLNYSSPTSHLKRQAGSIGKLKGKIWCGTLLFDKEFTFRYPEQEGSKSRPKNSYKKREKIAIRRAALQNLHKMISDPRYRLDRDELKPRVDAALKVCRRPVADQLHGQTPDQRLLSHRCLGLDDAVTAVTPSLSTARVGTTTDIRPSPDGLDSGVASPLQRNTPAYEPSSAADGAHSYSPQPGKPASDSWA